MTQIPRKQNRADTVRWRSHQVVASFAACVGLSLILGISNTFAQSPSQTPASNPWSSWFNQSPTAPSRAVTAQKAKQNPGSRSQAPPQSAPMSKTVAPPKKEEPQPAAAPTLASRLGLNKIIPTFGKPTTEQPTTPAVAKNYRVTNVIGDMSGTNAPQLGLKFGQDHMVFETGEQFQFSVIPRNIKIPETRTTRCRVVVVKARSNSELWSEEKDGVVSANGDVNPIGPFMVPMPRQEGAYDIHVFVNRASSANGQAAQQWSYQRTISTVVVAPPNLSGYSTNEMNSQLAREWKAVQLIDLVDPKLTAFNQGTGLFSGLVGRNSGTQFPGKGNIETVPFRNQTVSELGPQSYRVIPLQVIGEERPHILEFDYPADQPQTLSLGIIEAGQSSAAGLAVDRGFTVDPGEALTTNDLRTHRIVYWPATTSPWLVVANPTDAVARCGSIRMLAGGVKLPAEGFEPNPRERLVAVQIEDPCFIEAFTAGVALDRELTPHADWMSWYQTGNYLTQYVGSIGYNGASFPIVHSGGAIYPSQYLPSFVDPVRGTTTTQISDPTDKDVFELMLRQFEQKKLRCVPSLHLSCGIRELDELAERGEQGIYLTTPATVKENVTAPRYNLLHPKVQEVIQKIVAEIVSRYESHAAFAGLMIPMGTETCTHLPGGEWGIDAVTWSQFITEETGSNDIPDAAQAIAFFQEQPEVYARWLKWRCERVNAFYNRLAGELAKTRSDVKLYLCLPDVNEMPEAFLRQASAEANATSAVKKWLNECGLDPQLLAQRERIVLTHSNRLRINSRGKTEPVANLDLTWSEILGPTDIGGSAASVLRENRESTLALPEALQMAGANNDTVRFAGPSASGTARIRDAWLKQFVHSDLQAIFDGGQLPAMGQEFVIRDLAQSLRRLPRVPFADVATENREVAELAVVRTAVDEGNCYLYLANPTSSPCRVSVQFNAEGNLQLASLVPRELPAPRQDKGIAHWSIELLPMDFVAVVARGGKTSVKSYNAEVPAETYRGLSDLIATTRQKTTQRRRYRLENESLEPSEDAKASIPGWNIQTGPQTTAESVPSGRTNHGLRLTSQHSAGGFSVVASSSPIPIHQCERFAVGVWIRNNDVGGAPLVRLTLEAKTPQQVLVRNREFGTDARAVQPLSPLGPDWTWCQVEFESIPPETSELVFRIVLRKNGDVTIDDAAAFDFWLSPDEQQKLDDYLAAATTHVQQNHFNSAKRVFDTDFVKWVAKQDGLILPPSGVTAPAIAKTPISRPPPTLIVATPTQTNSLRNEFERLPPVDEPSLILLQDELPIATGRRVPTLSTNPSATGTKEVESTAAKPKDLDSPPNWFQRLTNPQPSKKERPSMFK